MEDGARTFDFKIYLDNVENFNDSEVLQLSEPGTTTGEFLTTRL
jgi:hypothetical protein